jgi:hypothetical protein
MEAATTGEIASPSVVDLFVGAPSVRGGTRYQPQIRRPLMSWTLSDHAA